MQTCVLTTLLLLSSSCFGYHIRDILIETEVSYSLFDTTLNSSSFETKAIPAKVVKIYPNQPIAFNQLNSNILHGVNELIHSKEVYDKFQQYFFESIEYNINRVENTQGYDKAILRSWINDFVPIIDKITIDVYALSAETLIISFGIHYDAIYEQDTSYYTDYEQLFRAYRYFDLVTGEEINPLTIISDSKRSSFESFVRKKISKKYNPLISDVAIKNGMPVFHGTGFYYLVQGHGEFLEYFTSGIPNIGVRLELEEILPFINKSGPFRHYIHITPFNSEIKEFHSSAYSTTPPFKEEQSYRIRRIEDFVERIPPNTGVKRSIAELQIGHPFDFKYIETQYLKNGQPQWQIQYKIIENKVILRDSLSYHYKKGVLSEVDRYEMNSRSSTLERVSRHYFDERSNIARIVHKEKHGIETPNEPLIYSVEHYTYHENYAMIQEYLESDQGKFFRPDITQQFFDDFYFGKYSNHTLKKDMIKRHEIKETEDSITVYHVQGDEKEIRSLYIKQNGLIVKNILVTNGEPGGFKRFAFNERNLPIYYEINHYYRKTGEFKVLYSTTAEYSELNLPIRLTIQQYNASPPIRDYSIRYTK